MSVVDVQTEVLVMGSAEKLSLREERKRTGRYMAAGVAIFLSLLGVYQAVVRGTPEYAALFAPALIMFVYIMWILYASKHQRKALRDAEMSANTEETMAYNAVDLEDEKVAGGGGGEENKCETPVTLTEEQEERRKCRKKRDDNREECVLNRSYSIA